MSSSDDENSDPELHRQKRQRTADDFNEVEDYFAQSPPTADGFFRTGESGSRGGGCEQLDVSDAEGNWSDEDEPPYAHLNDEIAEVIADAVYGSDVESDARIDEDQASDDGGGGDEIGGGEDDDGGGGDGEFGFLPSVQIPGYNSDGTKNSSYQHWRGMVFDAESRKFVCESDSPTTLREVPKANEWKYVPPTKMQAIQVTFNEAREVLMQHYIEEHNAFLLRLDELGIPRTKAGLHEFLYGSNSRYALAVTRTLGISYQDFKKLCATFNLTADFNQTASRLEADHRINYTGYMDAKGYCSLWKTISVVGKDGTTDKLWEEVQNALNRDCRDLFLTGSARPVKMRIALDDDKVHNNIAMEILRQDLEYLMGMKLCQHIKANCRGFTIDSAVSSATGFPLHFSVERSGDSNTTNYERMIKFMFHNAFTNSGAFNEALRGITFCSDRGYWNPTLIVLLLSFTATVFGTWKRAFWNFFTYNQNTKLGGRMVIDTKYGRSVFNAFSVWKDSVVKAVAWRSGTGKVAIAATSDVESASGDEVQKIDFTFKRGSDAKWYKSEMGQSERKLRGFPEVKAIGQPEDDYLWLKIKEHLEMLLVDMLTVSDLDTMWFELRKFWWTSSAVDSTIRSTAKLVDADDPIYLDYRLVLGYGGLIGHLASGQDNANNPDSSDSIANTSVSVDDVEAGDSHPGTIRSIIEVLLSPPITEAAMTDCISKVDQLTRICSTVDSNTMKKMLVELGYDIARLDVDHQKLQSYFKKWTKTVKIQSSNVEAIPPDTTVTDQEGSENLTPCYKYFFPYEMLHDKDVTRLLVKRVGVRRINTGKVPGPHNKPQKKSERVEVLKYLDHNPTVCNDLTEEDGSANDSMELSDVGVAVLTGSISRAFLKPHKDTADKSATRFGHQNEIPYLKQFFDDCQNGYVPATTICHIRNCGLAMMSGREYVRDSSDAIAFEKLSTDDSDDYSIDSFPVECKCRSGSGYRGSVKGALAIQRQIGQLGGRHAMMRIISGRRGAVYTSVQSDDIETISKLIPDPHERIQLLHHAFCYQKSKAALLVGQSTGILLYGIIVHYSNELLEAYGRILDYLYERGLNLFYSENLSDLPIKLIGDIMQGDDKLKSKYNLHDFFTSLLTFRSLIPSKSKADFPIPPCEKGIPYEHSLWNGSKGGSDTVTRFTYNCQAILPNRMPQSVIFARQMALYNVVFHRGSQAITMTKQPDPDNDTLKSIRDRNNARIAYRDSLQFSSTLLLQDDAVSATTPNEIQDEHTLESLVAPAPRQTNANKDSRFAKDHRIMEASRRTGATPGGRGRPLNPRNPGPEYQEFVERFKQCEGKPIKTGYMTKDENGNDVAIARSRRVCALCKSTSVSWECSICHQAFCFDLDRSSKLHKALKGDRAETIKEMAPELNNLARNDVPPVWVEAGERHKGKGDQKYVFKTCFHYCHEKYFLQSASNGINQNDDRDENYQLNSISRGLDFASSPNAS